VVEFDIIPFVGQLPLQKLRPHHIIASSSSFESQATGAREAVSALLRCRRSTPSFIGQWRTPSGGRPSP